MGTPLDSVLFTLRLLMVTITTRIKATGTVTQVDTITAGNNRSESWAPQMPAYRRQACLR